MPCFVLRLMATAAISVATALNPPAFQTSNNPNLLVDILNNNTANPLVLGRMPYIKDVPHLNHAGLRGKYARNSFELKYDFDNGMTFTGDYVTSKLRTMTAQTSSGDRGNGWIISPNILTDSSASVRLASDTTERFSWSTGGNYFLQTSVGGANGVGGLPSVLDATRVATYREPVTFTGQGRLHYFGGFLALHYDLTDQLAADFEGRYQRERVTTSYQLVTQTTSAFSAFIPRVILTYKPNSELTTYASWARGALPGTDNSIVPLLSATLQAQIQAAPGYTVAVPAESVQNFELGVKQQTARFRYALTGYYMKWNNLKNRVSYTCPGNQCGPTVVNATVNITLAQTAKIYGVEAEVGVALTDAWDVNLSADYVHGRYDRFFQPLTLPHTGQTNASGKTILGFPEAQAALTSTYRGNFNADWGWYLRGGLTYTGRNYVEEVNQSWIAPSAKLNLRAGVEHGDTRIDFYVDNLTDNKQWIGGLRAVQSNYNVGPTVASQATATMVLPRLRTFGVRVSTKFQ